MDKIESRGLGMLATAGMSTIHTGMIFLELSRIKYYTEHQLTKAQAKVAREQAEQRKSSNE